VLDIIIILVNLSRLFFGGKFVPVFGIDLQSLQSIRIIFLLSFQFFDSVEIPVSLPGFDITFLVIFRDIQIIYSDLDIRKNIFLYFLISIIPAVSVRQIV